MRGNADATGADKDGDEGHQSAYLNGEHEMEMGHTCIEKQKKSLTAPLVTAMMCTPGPPTMFPARTLINLKLLFVCCATSHKNSV